MSKFKKDDIAWVSATKLHGEQKFALVRKRYFARSRKAGPFS